MQNSVINLDDAIKTSLTVNYKDQEYVFPFSDKMSQSLEETWVKANDLVEGINHENKPEKAKDNDKIDKKPVADKLKFVESQVHKEYEIIIEFFNNVIGKTKADRLYKDLNSSTDGLLFVLGLVKRESDKALEDARKAAYPDYNPDK